MVAATEAALARHHGEAGGLLPILHDVQDAVGHVPPAVVPMIAAAVNLSRAEVHGVVTYYHHFRSSPPPARVVQICRAEACRSMGAEALLAHARSRFGCDEHGVSRDGSVLVEAAYCLGLCASSPAMFVGEELHARVTKKKFDAVMDAAKESA
ncbi:MAG: NAD(P)H-dependent oxidoreductase subunit E [Pseudomonadota bacterium]|nr:NAD(P)H-dependent oxidoreductase subunit E [Pseudomonadota bacterium]